ncbi:universal stress protein [Pseudalkalibacillus sp. A8]|uniref:universal stress protein n=1 Tax=Pseudalkalibacillus sp. A8 TaxID=3382641 RepID=UPI0038B4DB7E
MIYKNILVATNESNSSKQAIEFGVELAKKHNGELTLVYVMEETAVLPYRMEEDLFSTGSFQAMPFLESREGASEQGYDPLPRMELLAGDPAATICRYAKKNEIDMIVMGSRGLGGWKRLFSSSVSRKVVSKATCTVLVVK